MPRIPKLSLFILLSLAVTLGYSQGSFQVGFWNIENLFDTTNAVTPGDDDFTPAGRYQWTEERLSKKFKDLTRVIRDLNQEGDLAILGLAEIENLEVLTRLNKDYLQAGYEIVHKESPDERGIDCGLLYDPRMVELVKKSFIPIYLAGDDKTRDIIEAQFIPVNSRESKPLYVFINHWPSRWGGHKETDPLRASAAATLRSRIDLILKLDPKADIVILGDFNDHPNDVSLRHILKAAPPGTVGYPGDLINTTYPLHTAADMGTYVYRGEWGVLDQIIISSGMLDQGSYSWEALSTSAFRPDYLIEQGGKNVGWPFRMYRASKYQGGFSDHLAVTCRINYQR